MRFISGRRESGINASTAAELVNAFMDWLHTSEKTEVPACSAACASRLVVEIHGETPDRLTAARTRCTGPKTDTRAFLRRSCS
jgi:hypothetical protein